jgi:hypothetical protein
MDIAYTEKNTIFDNELKTFSTCSLAELIIFISQGYFLATTACYSGEKLCPWQCGQTLWGENMNLVKSIRL